MTKFVFLQRHMTVNESMHWFELPDFRRATKAVDENTPINGEFLGSDSGVDAALFTLDGESHLYVNPNLYALASPHVQCFFLSFLGLEIFALLSERRLRVIRVSFLKPRLIRTLMDPTYDEFDAVAEDFWYAAYIRWRAIHSKRNKGSGSH